MIDVITQIVPLSPQSPRCLEGCPRGQRSNVSDLQQNCRTLHYYIKVSVSAGTYTQKVLVVWQVTSGNLIVT